VRRITTPLIVLCLACGGRSDRDEPKPAGGGGKAASSAGTAGATAGAAGATAGVPSGGNAGGVACSDEAPPQCLENCRLVGDLVPSGTCEQGVARCPDGTTPFEECPPGTCLVNYASCCDPVTGMGSDPICAPNGYAEMCPVGTVRIDRAGSCAQLPGQPCEETPSDTNGQPCPMEGAECVYNQSCGTTVCGCKLGDSGLVWSCSSDDCP